MYGHRALRGKRRVGDGEGEEFGVRPRRWRLGLWLLPLLVALAGAGCTAPGDIDDTDSPVILVVQSIEPVNDPFGDVITNTGTIPDDVVNVTFAAHPKNPEITGSTGPELADVLIERFEVTFERTDGGSDVPKGFQRGMSLRVRNTPQGEEEILTSEAEITVAPSTTKAQPPISFLIDPGFEPDTGFVNIQVNATIRFFGRTISGKQVSAQGNIGINFADFAG